jgi:hypothetical protein
MTSASSASAAAWWVLPLVLLGIPLFWLALMWLIAHLGGWATLAKAFPARARPGGTAFAGLSLQLGPATSYGGCITAVFSPDGLFLVPFVLFRFAHRPLLIPWDNVGAPVEQICLGFRLVHLPITGARRSCRLGLSRRAQQWLRAGPAQDEWRPTFAPAATPAAPSTPFERSTAWRGH